MNCRHPGPRRVWLGGSEAQLMKSFCPSVSLKLASRSWTALKNGICRGPLWRPQIDGIRCKRGLAREVSPESHFGPCAIKCRLARSCAVLRRLWDETDGNRPATGGKKWTRRSPAEPSWPRDTGRQNVAVGGLARRLGTRGSRILGILGSLGSWEILGPWNPGISEILGPGRSWGLGSLGSWEILGPGKPGTPGILGDPGA